MESQLNSVFDMNMELEFIEVDSDGISGNFYHFLSLRISLKLQKILSGRGGFKKSNGSNRQISNHMLSVMVKIKGEHESHHRQKIF